MQSRLTLTDLRRMKPGIFAKGIYETDSGEEFRWVATRGQVHDWAIYHASVDWTPEMTRSNGKKIIDMELVEELVPCTPPALARYRK